MRRPRWGSWANPAVYGAVLAPASGTWNPADKSAGITLSGGNLFALGDGADWNNARSTTSHSSGKYYFGFRSGTTWDSPAVGFANSSQALDAAVLGDTTNGCSYFVNGGIRYGGVIGSIAGFSGGTVGAVAIDIGAAKFWAYQPGVGWDGDPGAGTGGYTVTNVVGGAVYACICKLGNTDPIEGIFDAATLGGLIAAPSGFSAWG